MSKSKLEQEASLIIELIKKLRENENYRPATKAKALEDIAGIADSFLEDVMGDEAAIEEQIRN